MGNDDENAPHADVVFMGAARVGKTTLVHRIMCVDSSLALEGRYAPTVEDSYIRQFLAGETSCRLRLVDTAGGYEFPAMERLWIKRASAFVLVCSRDDPSSLVHLRNLLNRIKNERQCDLKRLLLVLVMNKCDLHMKEWMIPDEDLELLADEYEIPYRSIVFTSALNQTGVAQIFKMLWEQNEESGTRVIKFEPRTSAAEINRRSSAFAVLFGNVQARFLLRNSGDAEAAAGVHFGWLLCGATEWEHLYLTGYPVTVTAVRSVCELISRKSVVGLDDVSVFVPRRLEGEYWVAQRTFRSPKTSGTIMCYVCREPICQDGYYPMCLLQNGTSHKADNVWFSRRPIVQDVSVDELASTKVTGHSDIRCPPAQFCKAFTSFIKHGFSRLLHCKATVNYQPIVASCNATTGAAVLLAFVLAKKLAISRWMPFISILLRPDDHSNLMLFFTLCVKVQPHVPMPCLIRRTYERRLTDLVFTVEDIRQLLHKINPFCALGPDEVHPRILKETSYTLTLKCDVRYGAVQKLKHVGPVTARHCHTQFDSTPATIPYLLSTVPPGPLVPLTANTTNSPIDPSCLHDTFIPTC
ncbi:GTP-binding protein Di-Ras2 [Clonorchis sinensis]|uniref:GTP-binding protein Di-Ras2 n=1 Tax=Clonorchis sinensis TaxID=79923 RepID=G7YEH7_CLOSI|nr:GTP-binding protein Di-Ras2 [Clonorchis sinensis]